MAPIARVFEGAHVGTCPATFTAIRVHPRRQRQTGPGPCSLDCPRAALTPCWLTAPRSSRRPTRTSSLLVNGQVQCASPSPSAVLTLPRFVQNVHDARTAQIRTGTYFWLHFILFFQVTTKAEPQEDGSYKITGTKIFISCGDHDMAENIVHCVLARLPGAPEGLLELTTHPHPHYRSRPLFFLCTYFCAEPWHPSFDLPAPCTGTRGISLFLVPKFLPGADGSVDPANYNNTNIGRIEDKMGCHGSPTCEINFDNAKGWLIGTVRRRADHCRFLANQQRVQGRCPFFYVRAAVCFVSQENRGLNHMFTFINTSRIGTAVQGVAGAENAYQNSLYYAKVCSSRMCPLTCSARLELDSREIRCHPSYAIAFFIAL